MTSAEWKRKAVHAGMGLFALSLRWLDAGPAAALAGAALLFNAFVMPRIGRGIYRDPRARRDAGIVAYPAMVLLLILVFAGKYLPVAAAVWAMMAFGDPAAAIAGRLIGGPTLPWNRGKTWIGLLANWAVASSAALAVFVFVTRRPATPDVGRHSRHRRRRLCVPRVGPVGHRRQRRRRRFRRRSWSTSSV